MLPKVKNPELTASLRKILEQECKLHARYIDLISKERELIRSLKSTDQTELLSLLTAERDVITQQLEELHKNRFELLKPFKAPKGSRFSAIIEANLHPDDLKELYPLIEMLKSLIAQNKKSSSEFGEVVNFAQNMMNGFVSLVMSTTQTIVRSYGRKGLIKESYHPTQHRKQGILKSA